MRDPMEDVTLVERLVDRLAAADLPSGSRLPPERTLARELGISRPALREATRALTGLRLLEPRVGSGTYLAEVELDDLMAVRLALEPLAAALAAERAADADRVRMRSLLVRMREVVDDPIAFADADAALHGAIAHASGNRFVSGSFAGLTIALRLSRARSAGDEGRRRAALAELDRLLGAIEKQSPDDAAAAMVAHLRGVDGTLRALESDQAASSRP